MLHTRFSKHKLLKKEMLTVFKYGKNLLLKFFCHSEKKLPDLFTVFFDVL